MCQVQVWKPERDSRNKSLLPNKGGVCWGERLLKINREIRYGELILSAMGKNKAGTRSTHLRGGWVLGRVTVDSGSGQVSYTALGEKLPGSKVRADAGSRVAWQCRLKQHG